MDKEPYLDKLELIQLNLLKNEIISCCEILINEIKMNRFDSADFEYAMGRIHLDASYLNKAQSLGVFTLGVFKT